MEEILHPHWEDGARKNDGRTTPSPTESTDISVWAVLFIVSASSCSGGRYDHPAHGFPCWCGWQWQVGLWFCPRSLWLESFDAGGYWKCHFPIGASLIVCAEYPNDSLESIVLLLAAWQRCVEVVRFRLLEVASWLSTHSKMERQRDTTSLLCEDACTTGKCFFHNHLRDVHGIPTKSLRGHLWVRWIRHCWKPITTT